MMELEIVTAYSFFFLISFQEAGENTRIIFNMKRLIISVDSTVINGLNVSKCLCSIGEPCVFIEY